MNLFGYCNFSLLPLYKIHKNASTILFLYFHNIMTPQLKHVKNCQVSVTISFPFLFVCFLSNVDNMQLLNSYKLGRNSVGFCLFEKSIFKFYCSAF